MEDNLGRIVDVGCHQPPRSVAELRVLELEKAIRDHKDESEEGTWNPRMAVDANRKLWATVGL